MRTSIVGKGGGEGPGESIGHRSAYVLLAVLCLLILYTQFIRSSTAAIGPAIIEELGLSPGALGTLTAAFFLVFTLFQIPAGLILDRYGPKRAIGGLLGVASLGCLVFAMGSGVWGLSVGRGLMAVGCSCLLMGAMILCARWFPPTRLGMVVGILLAVGNTGSLLATAPMAWSAALIGWRGSFVALAVLTVALIAVVVALVSDYPPRDPTGAASGPRDPEKSHAGGDRPSIWTLIAGLPGLLAQTPVRRTFVIGLVSYGALISILGLWGAPYLRHVHDLETLAIGRVLLVMAVATIIGPLIYGLMERFVPDRRKLVIFGSGGMVGFLLLLAVVPTPPVWGIAVILGGMGLIGTYNGALLAQSRSLFPEKTAGRGMTLINLAIMGGTTIIQLATGGIVQAFAGADGRVDELGYRLVFGSLAVTVALCLWYYARPLPASDR